MCSISKIVNLDPFQILWKKLKLIDRLFSVKIPHVQENLLNTSIINTSEFSYNIIGRKKAPSRPIQRYILGN